MIVEKVGSVFASKSNIIAHPVNIQGFMGGEVGNKIASMYPECEKTYMDYCNKTITKEGKVLLYKIKENYYIASCFSLNMELKTMKIYLRQCFNYIKQIAKGNNYTIAIQEDFGCDSVAAYGDKEKIFATLNDLFGNDKNIKFEIWRKEEEDSYGMES